MYPLSDIIPCTKPSDVFGSDVSIKHYDDFEKEIFEEVIKNLCHWLKRKLLIHFDISSCMVINCKQKEKEIQE